MPVGLAVPIITSGRCNTCVQAAPMTTTATKPQAAVIARQRVLCREHILDPLALHLEQGFHPASIAVVKHAARTVGCDHAMAAGEHGPLWRVDLLVAEPQGDQPDLSTVL